MKSRTVAAAALFVVLLAVSLVVAVTSGAAATQSTTFKGQTLTMAAYGGASSRRARHSLRRAVQKETGATVRTPSTSRARARIRRMLKRRHRRGAAS